MKFSLKKRLKSFSYALNGIRYLFITQHNAWIQVVIGIIAIISGIVLQISSVEWCIILLSIGSVLSIEAINTAIEHLSDTLHPDKSPGIKTAKDVAAGGVLIISIIAGLVGLIIFVPKILILFGC